MHLAFHRIESRGVAGALFVARRRFFDGRGGQLGKVSCNYKLLQYDRRPKADLRRVHRPKASERGTQRLGHSVSRKKVE